MKKTSVPEQAIYHYIKKFVDDSAENNAVKIDKYTADITLVFNGQKYNIEYDSFSQHNNSFEKDIERNKTFIDNGYNVIRMRDLGLKEVPFCINITFDFQNYSKKSLENANIGIKKLLLLFDVDADINISKDLQLIKQMYNDY